MTTVYLHIGLPKTGTTAIQNFLTANEAALKRHGICFPDLGLRYSGIGWRRNAHFLVQTSKNADGTKDRTRPCPEYESTLDKIAALSADYEKIILTDEGIWRASQNRPNFWTRIRDDFARKNLELRIIVYLRRQDEFVQSLYRQKIKSSSTCLPFDDYLNVLEEIHYPLDFYSYLNTLRDVFGKENLIVRIYGNNQYRGKEQTLLSDFLDIFGLSMEDGFDAGARVYNPSLGGTYLELRRLLNALPVSPKSLQLLRKSVGEIIKTNPYNTEPKNCTLFHGEEQAAFLERFADSNREAARAYETANPELFCNTIENLPEHTVDTALLLRDTILVYGNAIQKLEQKNNELEKKLQALQKQQQSSLWFRLKRKLKHILKRN